MIGFLLSSSYGKIKEYTLEGTSLDICRRERVYPDSYHWHHLTFGVKSMETDLSVCLALGSGGGGGGTAVLVTL